MRDMRIWLMYRNMHIKNFAYDHIGCRDVMQWVKDIPFDGEVGFPIVAAIQSYLVSEGQSNPPGPVALGVYIDSVSG